MTTGRPMPGVSFEDFEGRVMKPGDVLESLLNPGYRVKVERVEESRVIVMFGKGFRYPGFIEHAGDWRIVVE